MEALSRFPAPSTGAADFGRLLFIAQYANTRLPHGPLAVLENKKSPDGQRNTPSQRVLVSQAELLLGGIAHKKI